MVSKVTNKLEKVTGPCSRGYASQKRVQQILLLKGQINQNLWSLLGQSWVIFLTLRPTETVSLCFSSTCSNLNSESQRLILQLRQNSFYWWVLLMRNTQEKRATPVCCFLLQLHQVLEESHSFKGKSWRMNVRNLTNSQICMPKMLPEFSEFPGLSDMICSMDFRSCCSSCLFAMEASTVMARKKAMFMGTLLPLGQVFLCCQRVYGGSMVIP